MEPCTRTKQQVSLPPFCGEREAEKRHSEIMETLKMAVSPVSSKKLKKKQDPGRYRYADIMLELKPADQQAPATATRATNYELRVQFRIAQTRGQVGKWRSIFTARGGYAYDTKTVHRTHPLSLRGERLINTRTGFGYYRSLQLYFQG